MIERRMMTRTSRWVIAAAAALGLAASTVPFTANTPLDIPLWAASDGGACDADGEAANMDFVINDMDGKDINLADYKGKVVLLDFWATWCGPCKYEIPFFVELQDQYRDQGLVVLGFSVDDTVDKLKPFAAEFKMNYPVLVGLGREDVQEAFGPLWGIPVTFVIGRDGAICKKHMGMSTKEQFEKEIKELL